TPGEFAELLRLPTPDGTPLPWRVVRLLPSVPGRRRRWALARRAARRGWSAATFTRELRALRGGPASAGGRPPRLDGEGPARQLVSACETWLRGLRVTIGALAESTSGPRRKLLDRVAEEMGAWRPPGTISPGKAGGAEQPADDRRGRLVAALREVETLAARVGEALGGRR